MQDYVVNGELGFSKEEIDFISLYTKDILPLNSWHGSELKDFIAFSRDIRKSIKLHLYNKTTEFSESNYTGIYSQYLEGLGDFNYAYQRHDLKFLYQDWLRDIYDIKNKNFTNVGLLVSSGMSALSLSLFALKKLEPKYKNVCLSKDGYFEIDSLVSNLSSMYKKLYFQENMQDSYDIAILDSSCTVLPSNENLKLGKVIIIDTTCWEPGNPFFKNLLSELQDFKGIIILARSHIKLDCFGIEFNRLGSAVILSSDTQNEKKLKELEDIFRALNGNIGLNLGIEDHYFWLNKKKFHELCRSRTEAIRKSVRKIDKNLSSNIDFDFEIIKPQHELFLFAKFLKSKPTDPIAFKEKIRETCSLANQKGISIVPAGSFALCCTTINGFKGINDNEVYIRIAPSPNMNSEHLNKISNFLSRALESREFHSA